jgi:Protein of unknown function (DUF3987)
MLIPCLYELQPHPEPLKFSEGAQTLRNELAAKHQELTGWQYINKKLANHIGKYDGIFGRLCVLWHCIEHAKGPLPQVLTEQTARQVADFMHRFLLPHATAFYAAILETSDDHDRLSKIADHILDRNLTTISARDVQAAVRSARDLKSYDVQGLFEQLEAFGWLLKPAEHFKRKDARHWDINPRVHERFVDRAKRVSVEKAKARRLLQTKFLERRQEKDRDSNC